jgi:predicted ATPase
VNQSLSLKQFTAFEEAKFDFSPSINVLIGENATGKSHVMKILYTMLKVCENAHQRQISYERSKERLHLKLHDVFQVNNDNKLVRSMVGMAEVYLAYASKAFNFKIGADGFLMRYEHLPNPSPSIYLPAQEFLSKNEGFIAAYDNRELAYDETYYDLSLALNALPLRREKLADVQSLIAFLRKIIAGENGEENEVVRQENGRFYFDLPEGDLDIHLVADGYRKIGTLLYLLRNGSLTKDSILFWDEPEANLNPKLIVEVAKVLQTLAATGMQIFIATHDYLLSHELSLLAEYQSVDIKFFSLHKPDIQTGVIVEEGKILADIEHNPILEEFAAQYDREGELFYRGH